MAFDIEANTKFPNDPKLWMRCFAVADQDEVIAVDCKDCDKDDWQWFCDWLVIQPLIVFNMLYEVPVLKMLIKAWITPVMDCYMLMKFLGGPHSSDSMVRHGLKAAMVEIFGWEKNDTPLKAYMQENCFTWANVRDIDWDILAKYNALDADATWRLYEYFKDLSEKHWTTWGKFLPDWHRDDCINAGMMQAESIVQGLKINESNLAEYTEECRTKKQELYSRFMNHELLSPYITEYNQAVIAQIADTMPNEVTKTGKANKNWIKKQDKLKEYQAINHFNISSAKQLAWLLFEKAGFKPIKFGASGPSVDKETQQSLGEPGKLLLGHKAVTTELKFLDQLRSNNTSGRLHPKVIFPGTDTGRVVSREEIGE